MTQAFTAEYTALLASLCAVPAVRALGKTGGSALPAGDESDIDIMIFCAGVPSQSERERLTGGKNVADDPHWGHVDFASFQGGEVCLMYHDMEAFSSYIEGVLRGDRLEREGDFYPTGCISSLLGLHLYADKDGAIARMQENTRAMPDSLAQAMTRHHTGALHSTEDFRRAIERKDALFYHAALEYALDHFLQALFAVNRTWFPSRKRMLRYLQDFAVKPESCADRLLRAVELGARADTLAESYGVWKALEDELRALI